MINLYNKDCMDAMKDMADNQYDLAIVDPPYGIDVTKMNMGSRKRAKEDKKKSWDNSVPNDKYFKELFRVSKNQIIWGGNYFNLPCSQYFCIWDKGETMYGRDFAEAEFAWVSNGGTRIYKKNPNQLNRIHPTQKHISLYEFCLMNYAKEGDKILDTHLGSGSIAIACHNLKYDLDAYEIDKEYYEATMKRFKNHTSQKQLWT